MGKISGMGLTTLLLAVALVGSGCVFVMDSPTTPLTSGQVIDVLACQETIKKEGVEFLEHKIEKLEKCLDKVLEAQVKLENGLIAQHEFDGLLATARGDCRKRYAEIRKDSTKLVDKIASKCTHYAETYLTGGPECSTYDPLQYSQLMGGCSTAPGAPISAVDSSPAGDLGGFICGVQEVAADLDLGFQVPRMASLLLTLGPEFYVEQDPLVLPNVPLDQRCFFLSGGLPSRPNLNLLRRP